MLILKGVVMKQFIVSMLVVALLISGMVTIQYNVTGTAYAEGGAD